jgi:hypothetical protein
MDIFRQSFHYRPLSKKFAARLSFSGTQRDGVVENISTLKKINDVTTLDFAGSYFINHQITLHLPWQPIFQGNAQMGMHK